MSNLFFLLSISTFLLANCFGLNCWMSDEEDGDPIKKQENCLKSHCFVVSCGGMVAHGCGDGVEACDQMKRTCLDATVQSNKVGEFLGQNRDNRCALCQGDLCNTPEKLTAPEKPHKCWKIVASEELREGEGSVLSKIDCGLEAVGCYTINGTGGKVSKGCFVNEPAFNLLRKLLDAEIEQTKLCIGDFCNA